MAHSREGASEEDFPGWFLAMRTIRLVSARGSLLGLYAYMLVFAVLLAMELLRGVQVGGKWQAWLLILLSLTRGPFILLLLFLFL